MRREDVDGMTVECNTFPAVICAYCVDKTAKTNTGSLEPDYQSFDWNDDVYRPFDTPENIKEYPEAFVYECCNEDATSEGCQLTRHVDKVDP